MHDYTKHLIHKNNRASLFTRVAQVVATWTGKPVTFFAAIVLIVLWGASGPVFGFNDTWQLVINTSTTIITFLMVFVIQSSQNRDTRAIQIKLDELIRATRGASNRLIALEQLTPTEIVALQKEYLALAEKAREIGLEFDLGTPDISAPTSI